jgi:hypothetical protein
MPVFLIRFYTDLANLVTVNVTLANIQKFYTGLCLRGKRVKIILKSRSAELVTFHKAGIQRTLATKFCTVATKFCTVATNICTVATKVCTVATNISTVATKFCTVATNICTVAT